MTATRPLPLIAPPEAAGTSVDAENRALRLSAGAFLACLLLGFVVFVGQLTPLMGASSVGLAASLAAGCCGTMAFAASAVRGYAPAASAGALWRRAWDTPILALTAGAIVVLLTLSVFAVLALAFPGLRLDTLLSLIVAISAAVSSYVLTLIAAEISTLAVMHLLMLALVGGGFASMLSASDPDWWQRNFSALGAGGGFSAYAFNVTLVLAGLVLAVLSGRVVDDLRAITATPRRRLIVLRWWFAVAGFLLIGVGCISIETSKVLHTMLAALMGVLFFALIGAMRFLVPELPRSFFTVSTVLETCFGVVVLLMWPARYFNLTAVELIGSVVLFIWLLVLVRTITARGRDLESEPSSHAGVWPVRRAES